MRWRSASDSVRWRCGDRRLKGTETFLVIDWFLRLVSVILISILTSFVNLWYMNSIPLRISLLCSVRFGGGTAMEAWRRKTIDAEIEESMRFYFIFFLNYLILEKINFFFFLKNEYLIY
jgi:hypothetical protein